MLIYSRIINIKLIKDNEYIYIFQQRQVDERASGIMAENSESMTIENSYLNKEINIHEGNQDNNWILVIDENGIVFSIDTLISKEECIKIAENIDYY